MQERVYSRENGWILISILVVAAALWWYYRDWSMIVYVLLGLMGVVLVSGLLLFRPRWYQLMAFGLVPLSLELELGSGARMSFPSEALFVAALPFFFLFDVSFRKAAWQVFFHPLGWVIIAILFTDLMTGLLGAHPDVSLKRVAVKLIFLLTFLPMAGIFIKNGKGMWPWLVYLIGLIPVMYFTLRNHAEHGFDPRVVFDICEPYFNDHTVYGACLAFCIPVLLVFMRRRKVFQVTDTQLWLLAVLLIVLLVSEVLALSRAALMSLLVAGLFAWLLRIKVQFRVILIALLLIGGGIGLFSDDIYRKLEENEAVSNDGELVHHFSSVTNVHSDASNLERINRWVCAWRMFEERPLLGFGPGTYQFEYNKFQSSEYKTYISTNTGNRGNAHSEYLTYLSETGIVGFLLFTLLVFGSLYHGMQNHYRVQDSALQALNLMALLGLVTFYFHGIFNAFIDQVKMAALVYLAIGTIIAVHRFGANENEFET